ncbi:tetratricopeptide repeat protein [Glaciecola sp. 1036]|uniref:tetratricopeptide repeat protein n=1 Tax=Alteromonadaceae TaxID=72275 RepID=UPI003D02A13E
MLQKFIYLVFFQSLLIVSFIVKAADTETVNLTAYEFIQAYSTKDNVAMRELFNMQTFTRRVADSAGFNKGLRKQYLNLFNDEAQSVKLVGNMFVAVDPTTFVDIAHVRNTDYQNKSNLPVIRTLYNDDSMEYYLIDVSDKGKINDIFMLSRGAWLSVTVGRSTAIMLGQTEGLFDKIVQKLTLDKSPVEYYQPVIDAFAKRDFEAAYNAIQSLPESLRNLQPMLELSVFTSMNLNNELYMQALTDLYKAHGDKPELAFLFMDYHFLNNDLPAVVESLDASMKVTGIDAELSSLKGNMFIMQEKFEEAEKSFNEGIEAEPDYIETYWGLVTVYNSTKRYAELAELLLFLNDKFDTQISGETLIENEFYQDFVQSPAFINNFL